MAQYLDTTQPPPRAGTLADEVPLFGGGRARRIRRRRHLSVVSIVLTVLLAGGGVYVLSQRNVTTAVGLDEAVRHFRTDTIVHRAPVTKTKTAQAAHTTEAAGHEDRSSVADAKDAKPAGAPVVASAPYTVPDEGVYAYRTKGGESVSAFGASHTYPDETFATVRHLGGCNWENRNEVIKEHVDTRTFCGEPGSITQLAQRREVTFFGKTEGPTLDCKPPLVFHHTGDVTGTTRTSKCTDGDGTDANLVSHYLGTVAMTVGDVRVDAVHIHIDGTMTGKVDGGSKDDLWLDPQTGLTLRWERSVDTLASAFGAKVRYKENASFTLESLEPKQ